MQDKMFITRRSTNDTWEYDDRLDKLAMILLVFGIGALAGSADTRFPSAALNVSCGVGRRSSVFLSEDFTILYYLRQQSGYQTSNISNAMVFIDMDSQFRQAFAMELRIWNLV